MVIALVLAAVLIPGGYILASALLAVSCIGFFELTRATGIHTEGKRMNELEVCGYISIIVHYLQMVLIRDYRYYVFSIMFAFFLIMVCYVLRFPRYSSVQAITCFFCFIYVFYDLRRISCNNGIFRNII